MGKAHPETTRLSRLSDQPFQASAGLVVLARAVALDPTRDGPGGHHGDAALEGEEESEGKSEADRAGAEAMHVGSIGAAFRYPKPPACYTDTACESVTSLYIGYQDEPAALTE